MNCACQSIEGFGMTSPCELHYKWLESGRVDLRTEVRLLRAGLDRIVAMGAYPSKHVVETAKDALALNEVKCRCAMCAQVVTAPAQLCASCAAFCEKEKKEVGRRFDVQA